jgi:hypothetical protein
MSAVQTAVAVVLADQLVTGFLCEIIVAVVLLNKLFIALLLLAHIFLLFTLFVSIAEYFFQLSKQVVSLVLQGHQLRP